MTGAAEEVLQEVDGEWSCRRTEDLAAEDPAAAGVSCGQVTPPKRVMKDQQSDTSRT